MRQSGAHLALLFFVIFLMSCAESDEDDLQIWMKNQRNEAKANVLPLSEPKKFRPQAYTQESLTDPFNILKLTQALKNDTPQKSNNSELVAPELNRRKEPLEAFPIDAMKMVGSVVKKGQPLALIKIDNLLYQVRMGNYLGPNYGRVIAVSENQVSIREIVQDAAGEWIERPVNLLLQESEK
jgi:type IV pilus assembly protein PilP